MSIESIRFAQLHIELQVHFSTRDSISMSLVSHKKSYLVCAILSNLRILCNILLFSSSCLCHLLAVSVLYFEKKNRNRLCEYLKILQFDTYQIAFPRTQEGKNNREQILSDCLRG
jgi:hypothetical protein